MGTSQEHVGIMRDHAGGFGWGNMQAGVCGGMQRAMRDGLENKSFIPTAGQIYTVRENFNTGATYVTVGSCMFDKNQIQAVSLLLRLLS